MDREEECKFDIKTVEIGILPMSMKNFNQEKWVTPVAKELGVGAVLFLMTMKALFYLFALLSIINIPLFLFYVRGNGG